MNHCPSHDLPNLSALPKAILTGKEYWRSLDELSDKPEFREWLEREFPNQASEWLGGTVSRRRALQIMGASLGLAGLAGCRRPEYPILPYTKTPETVLPGLPTSYATTLPRPGSAFPVLVETQEGRPTKIEGNPLHPWSQGATDLQAQAAVLDLYDPDRSREVLRTGKLSSWANFDSYAETHISELHDRRGQGLHFLSDDISSPALRLLHEHIREVLPEAVWHVHEAIGGENVDQGTALAFGKPLAPTYRFQEADVILSLGCDFLGVEDGAVAHTRAFAARRKVENNPAPMNRLYVIENHPTTTGGMADHRLRLPASHAQHYVLALAQELLSGTQYEQDSGNPISQLVKTIRDVGMFATFPSGWVREVATDLLAARGRSLILAGRQHPPLVHALVQLLNAELGNLGNTVLLRERPGERKRSLSDLMEAIRRDKVGTLVILGGNPVYDSPADLELGVALRRVPHTIRLGLHADETSAVCGWHLPMAHFLECWGDAETADGTYSPIQPLIAPLFGGRSVLEVVARICRYDTTEPYEIVQRSFRQRTSSGIEEFRQFLHDGLLRDSTWPLFNATPNWAAVARAVEEGATQIVAVGPNNLELSFHADRRLFDGRFANNGWLQETPDPLTKLTWDNAAMLSPETARLLGVSTGDVLELSLADRSLQVPAYVLPGQADDSISLPLGFGRTHAGRVGNGVGCNPYKLRTTALLNLGVGVQVRKTGSTHPLACTQDHGSMQGRDLVRSMTLQEFQDMPAVQAGSDSHSLPLYKPAQLDGQHQWGMIIDLNQCTGCSACVVACQSENNIPIVGKDEVLRGREMHWIRVDRYFTGSSDDPGMAHQPVACVHCENAPCETVCPVNAAVHSPEGLNLQVYNRCIGTRYCANNCPYKVRRFNWFDYHQRPLDQLLAGPLGEKGMPELLQMQKNPDVTVRMRGVMEKCTYCVQRIERGKTGARLEAAGSATYAIPDGTIVPACAQACPAQAIIFGDLADPNSKVAQAKQRTRNYDLLGELGTRPRTSHQFRVRNPNPRLAATTVM
jgi:MoCo/4Fe-4S cofactor protein with predicted Tat translocation signal